MLKNFTLVLASLLFGLVLIELFLRLLGWSFPVYAQPDDHLGWSLRPGLQGWSVHENTAYVRINGVGFRGQEWPQHPSGFRVAVLGDSFVESSNLPEEHALTNLIERDLRACPAFARSGAEVLNLGVSGYGTAQEYLLLTGRVESLHASLVLLAFYAGNDVANNSRALSASSQKEKPYFIDRPSGAIELDDSFRSTPPFQAALAQDWRKRLVNASYLLQAFKQVALGKPIVPTPTPLALAHVSERAGEPLFAPEYPQLFSPPAGEAWRAAWSVTEKLLLRMRDWAQERHVDFAMIIVPAPVQALPTQAMRRAAIEKFEIADLNYPAERIARFAAENRISFLDLREALRSHGDSERVFLYGFAPQLGEGHLNAAGNAVSGRAIARWLCERQQVRP